ncbi:glycoside hydrolase family 13 protein [Microbacterium sp. X-17]|uniref:glycoside hydrolase family 13 protein n=1 Tax=Microbacterium sp. X-17 TaxID=3144404 RepID=UPI0031F4984B
MTDQNPAPTPSEPWWRSAVIYQVYPRSFADGNGDGTGDLPGITQHLPYLRDLGVDAIWISPFYPSPQADGGYDVADYFDVDPLFGTLDDADTLINAAHELGIRVIVDVVPNHTSDEHPWFQAALTAAPGSPERDRYIFRDGETIPNNWPADFGGPAWTQLPDGQWYLHLFDPKQPDLNWNNPDVRAMFLDVIRFWLDHGVDGFRVDVANALVKAPDLPDFEGDFADIVSLRIPTNSAPFYDQDGVHEIWREWRTLIDTYPGERILVAEAWVNPPERLALYVRPDEFHQAFNFAFLLTSWDAPDLRHAIAVSLSSNGSVGAPSTWVLSNHDVVRHATRLGFPGGHTSPWLEADYETPDPVLGLRRARAATTLMLALPGSAYLYYGEELGLPEVLDLPADARQDPTFARTNGAVIGRDGARVPMPWNPEPPAYGFSSDHPTHAPWLPQPTTYAHLAASTQTGDPESTLELYRTLLRHRRTRQLGAGTLHPVPLGDDLITFDVTHDNASTRVVLNLGSHPWQIPSTAAILAHSEGRISDVLLTDEAVWLDLSN